MPPSASDDSEAVRRDVAEAVTMTAGELERRLETGESRSVGQKAGPTEEDLAHMRKVHGYVARYVAQRPEQEAVETSRWRYSLMNWGHDLVKEA